MKGPVLMPAALLAILFLGCGSLTPGVSSRPSPTGETLNMAQLKFRIIDLAGAPFVCGPPVVRAGGDESEAAAQFPAIKADSATYQAIVAHSHPPGDESSSGYKLAVWRDWQALQLVHLAGGPDSYDFDLQTAQEIIKGTVDSHGQVRIGSRRPARKLCPICLAATTLIETPGGAEPVVDLKPGSAVWTASPSGERILGVIIKVGSVAFPHGHEALRVRLADGRTIVASAGHPLGDGRTLAVLQRGDAVDGSTVADTAPVHLDDGATYDILPSGPTGEYWASGILVGSTLLPSFMGPGKLTARG